MKRKAIKCRIEEKRNALFIPLRTTLHDPADSNFVSLLALVFIELEKFIFRKNIKERALYLNKNFKKINIL